MASEDRNASLDAAIDALSDAEVLMILQQLGDNFAVAAEVPTDSEKQDAIQAALAARGQTVELPAVAAADRSQAAAAARVLMKAMGRTPEMQMAVRSAVNNPPGAQQNAIPLIFAVPIVFTGCVAFLQVVGKTEFKFTDGKVTVHYDPGKESKFDDTLREVVKTLGTLMGKLIPGAGGG
jgi:hypothetical protein